MVCQSHFSQNLIDRITRYFKIRCDIDISPETAVEYLNSTADLYGSLVDCMGTTAPEAHPLERGGDGAVPVASNV